MSDSEKNFALRQGHGIASEDGYFEARPQIDSIDRRKVFGAGFERGWEAALAAAPAQPDTEVEQLKQEIAGLRAALVIAQTAMQDFREKVHSGRAKSTDSYDKFSIACKTIKAALAGTAPVSKEYAELPELFREALAWGMTFGPEIPAHQWDEMRESMVESYTHRATHTLRMGGKPC